MHLKDSYFRFRTLAASVGAVVLLIVALRAGGQQRETGGDRMFDLLEPGQRVLAFGGGGGYSIHLMGERGAETPGESTLGPTALAIGTLTTVSQDHLVIQLDMGWESHIATDAVTQIVVREK